MKETFSRESGSESLADRHAQWLHREINELGKSFLVTGISVTVAFGLLKLVSPELAGNFSDWSDPSIWGAIAGTDYMRRRTHGRN